MGNAGVVAAVVSAVICTLVLGGCAVSADSVGADASPATTTHQSPVMSSPSADPGVTPPDPATSGEQVQHAALEPAVEPPAPAPAGTAPAEADSAPVVIARCADEQLTLAYRARPQDSGAGSFAADLVFTNVSATDCSFAGWPGLIAADAAGAQLGGPGLAEGITWETVVLTANGGAATAKLHGTNPGAFGCPAAMSTTLRAFISFDGAGPGVAVAQAIPVCSDHTSTLGVGALVAG
jgi:hypothetical protein